MGSNKLRNGVSRVDAYLLMRALVHIDASEILGERANNSTLRAETGLATASVARLISNARMQYGVHIEWQMHTSTAPGSYRILDWGVFDRDRVIKFEKVRPRNFE